MAALPMGLAPWHSEHLLQVVGLPPMRYAQHLLWRLSLVPCPSQPPAALPLLTLIQPALAPHPWSLYGRALALVRGPGQLQQRQQWGPGVAGLE